MEVYTVTQSIKDEGSSIHEICSNRNSAVEYAQEKAGWPGEQYESWSFDKPFHVVTIQDGDRMWIVRRTPVRD